MENKKTLTETYLQTKELIKDENEMVEKLNKITVEDQIDLLQGFLSDDYECGDSHFECVYKLKSGRKIVGDSIRRKWNFQSPKIGDVYLLNTPILTEYGKYEFSQISLEDAKGIMAEGFVSAIGHEATASFMTAKFGISIPMNRISVRMEVNDQAIVFRLLDRLPEGKILSLEEMGNVRYEIGLLRRVE